MNIISLDYIKAHSRIDEITNGSAEANLIELYAESSEETVLNYLERSLDDIVECYGGIPAPIKHATLMLVDNSYQHKSPLTMTNLYRVDYSFDNLLRPYMIL